MGQKESRSKFVGGLDLIQAAKNELDFLALVDEHPNLFSGPVVKNAIRRYELLWLPLISHHQRMCERTDLAAPLDIAWVWHVHMLAPCHYEQDCNNIVSGLVDHCLLRQVALQRAKSLWEERYPHEPFEINVDEEDSYLQHTYSSRIKYNLEEACQRQFKFYYQVSLPHYCDSRFLKDAVNRYITHLRLKQKNPDVFLVPCYDFDLIWHAHQQHPIKYKQSTTKCLGRILNHDDSETDRAAGSKLYDSAIKTRAIWKKAGCSFEKAGAMYRGDPPDPKVPHGPLLSVSPAASTEYRVCILNHDDSVTDRAAGSKLYDSAIKTRAIWKKAGCSFEKAGAMYRGDPPDPKVPHGPLLSVSHAASTEYRVCILKAEGINFNEKQLPISIRKTDHTEKLVFHSSEGSSVSFPFIVSEERMLEIAVGLPPSNQNFDIINFLLRTFEREGTKTLTKVKRCVTLDVDVNSRSYRGKDRVRLTIYVDFARPREHRLDNQPLTREMSPRSSSENRNADRTRENGGNRAYREHSFTVAPRTTFAHFYHPIKVLSCPELMLSPEDMARPFMLCESSTHRLLDSRHGDELFQCRVVHSNQGNNPLSAVEILDLEGKAVASAHVLSPNALPQICAIDSRKTCVFVDDACKGERAMLVRVQKDYGVCIGKWKEIVSSYGLNCFMEIKFFKLQGKQGWCGVRKFKGGLYEVEINCDNVLRVDLKEGIITMSPFCQDIPQILAIALSVSVLYLLCKPYFPKESKESSPCYHLYREADRLSPMIYAAGYNSTIVPTNTALMYKSAQGSLESPDLKYASYDLDEEAGYENEEAWKAGRRREKDEKKLDEEVEKSRRDLIRRKENEEKEKRRKARKFIRRKEKEEKEKRREARKEARREARASATGGSYDDYGGCGGCGGCGG